jgi:hypothetical protein
MLNTVVYTLEDTQSFINYEDTHVPDTQLFIESEKGHVVVTKQLEHLGRK